MELLNNLSITTVNRARLSTMGALFNTLQSRLANGGRDRHCHFYYNNGAGGSVLQVAARGVAHGAVAALKDLATNEFNSRLRGKKELKTMSSTWLSKELAKQEEESKKYGVMKVNGGKAVVYALDDWGCISTDALMLGIEVEDYVQIKQNFPSYANSASRVTITKQDAANRNIINEIQESDTLVWYDTTALVNISSDKNIVTTKVQGRDYSRKELVSNGDIKFSVSGQITSGKPDIYPDEEVRKFLKVMQYKGVVRVNHQVLDQLGITHIVITDYSLNSREGYKSVQQYSFSAIGLQPKKLAAITEDTVTILPQKPVIEDKNEGSEWLKMLQTQIGGLKNMAGDLFSQSAGLASGMLDNIL